MSAAPVHAPRGAAPGGPVDTHCPYCALQCATTLTPEPVGADGVAGVGVAGRAFPTNRGGLCQKGWTAGAVLRAGDRLTAPLVRGRHLGRTGAAADALEPTSWDTALDLVAGTVRRVQAESGPDAVAVFGGGGLTNEKAYALGALARAVLRTSRIDYNGRFCMSSAAAAGNRAFGLDRGLPFPLTDLGGADAVLLVGSNLAETMPPAQAHLARAVARGGLVVVDPRRTPTAALAEDGGGLHLQNVPGTDLALVLGIAHVVLAEGLADEEYLAARTTGADALRRSLAAWWPERTERVTGVPASLVRAAALRLAAASPHRGGAGAYVLTGRGAEQHAKGTDTVTACINLALALGLPGVAGSGWGCITGQGNGQGGREHGQKSDQLPGYRKIDDPAARAHVAAVWGVDPDELPGPGLPAVQLLRSLGRPGGSRVLLVHGSNLVVSAPRSGDVVERLGALDLLVVADLVPSETALLADVVLPVPQWAEEEGTMTSLEGRVLRRRRAVPPPAGVRDELEVWADLAERLGRPGILPRTAAEAFDGLRRASAGGTADYSGITWDRLDAGEALHWPCPDDPASAAPTHPGTPRTFLDGFATPDGRARIVPVDHRPPADDLRPDAPLHLVTGRVLQHYQSGAQTRRVAELVAAHPAPFVELHPDLAARLEIDEGADVELTTARGTARAVARFSGTARPDTVFMAFHWAGEGSVNRLTNDALDPVSSMPEFKVCAVSVRLAPPRPAAGTPVLEEVPA
ncbi:molybdopterin oxidoreductase family protein [Cellulomonas endophytica]|uniref:molybdopterin oxidoreductase family protein n=1 Tax=Cellulomonas endophytica TaxID=2494735 RepID=UPI001011D482|nr:molybdopterin oxidoreductase family protein [Cellulomonas endophytica]